MGDRTLGHNLIKMRAKLANLNHCAVPKSLRRQLVQHKSIIAVVTLKEVDRKYANHDWL